MRRIFFVAGVSCLLLFALSIAGPTDGLEFQSESVATTQFTTSGMINPAGLSFFSASGIRYAHSFTDSTYRGDDALLISSRRGFFGIEWLNNTTDIFRRKYTLAIGDRMAPNFYAGFSYQWFGGSNELYRKMKDWKIGFLYRPRPMVSMGLVIDRLNEPRFGEAIQKRSYRPGIAVRPLGRWISLSSDMRWVEGQSSNRIQGNFRFAADPGSGIHFAADYKTEGFWHIGITFDFQQTRIGTQVRTNNASGYDGGSYFVEFGETRYSTIPGRAARTGTMTLGGEIAENPDRSFLFGSSRKTFLDIITALRKGASDDRIGALIMKIDGVRLNFANSQEIRDALLEYRRMGKRVTVYIENGGNLAYYVASAADEIIMNPSGYLMLDGLSARATFYKGTMDKLGVRAQVVRTGPHKTAGDAFTEDGLTGAAEEQINWLLDDLYGQIVEGISTGRRILPDEVRRLIDSGPYTAKGAFDAGLVDQLLYYDEASSKAEEKRHAEIVDLQKFYSVRDFNARWSEPKHIAVVYAEGAIVSGSSGRDLLQGKVVGGKTLAKSLARVRKDPDIKAVVMRVNSPGGDLFGSDRIYRELELLKGKKPVVVSMGGVAASGGYYISSPGDEILASPSTITGSIGVIMGKADLSGFYEKIGYKETTLKRGKRADILTTDRPATEDEIEHVTGQIWQFYSDFVSKVSTWRGIGYDSVDAIGQGRVWTGRQARANGLVDTYGGIWEAIESARQKAGIDPEDDIVIESYPPTRFSITEWLGIPSIRSPLETLIERPAFSGWQLRLPFDLDIE